MQVLKLKRQGLSNSLIAQRLGVTQGAIYHVLRKMDFAGVGGKGLKRNFIAEMGDN